MLVREYDQLHWSFLSVHLNVASKISLTSIFSLPFPEGSEFSVFACACVVAGGVVGDAVGGAGFSCNAHD